VQLVRQHKPGLRSEGANDQ